ncbi:molybdopterin molybdotransferase MoeA [Pusillimonas caeni]|uniref:molybdopterin molybdotransferase MoeA n=1 Tax=Pusillimonas caeni TaxID=1348472 RepID=UPI000E599F28|nr:gephyrin-like molybdotransferase Glp [Pusillimonas caeni]TFL13274.1 molybdopterin molybdotransferase MoeA [Pusillimonas caeni]
MLDFDVAQAQLAQAGNAPRQTEDCPLHEATGRILARSLTAHLDMPPADNSAMDGYAIRFADYQPGRGLPVQQRCYAGEQPQPLQAGQCIRIFTGSLIPEGADTVVIQEDTSETDNVLLINEAPELGAHIRRRGEDVRKDSILLEAGRRIGAAEIALLASQGYARVPVHPRLKIGILTTGDELAEPGTPLKAAQIYNSNGPMLATLVAGMGALPVHVLHARDTLESLEQALDTLIADCDLILSVGGVSVGEKDLVKPAIEKAGGELDLWRVRMKPGKPVALAHAQGKPIVCLPGNPVSAFAVFALLVSPLVRRMQGREQWLPSIEYARLDSQPPFNDIRDEFIRVRAERGDDGSTRLGVFSRQGSGVISSLPWSDGLARIPAGRQFEAGDLVPYYSWSTWLV